ncbi:MAG: nucleoside triphosphate pyrophosphohydrolase family protein [Alphaproteobacteria bacterium]|nr:nucleoside triphosphate pyrophosphohydrolase family protein [Alphaproteobacteria bacterium]MDD9920036.1 nucleoside triphosphate pyrophosphohydrolase family protein [Alphaproteobacteria bacterium]
MNVTEYQKWTRETALYPEANTGSVPELMYLSLGLAGEAAEIANKVKKLYRDGDSAEKRQAIQAEMGDVLWYLGRLAEVLDGDLAEILQANQDKLMSRKDRGVLSGSGDNR